MELEDNSFLAKHLLYVMWNLPWKAQVGCAREGVSIMRQPHRPKRNHVRSGPFGTARRYTIVELLIVVAIRIICNSDLNCAAVGPNLGHRNTS